jgi:hypothetical protein
MARTGQSIDKNPSYIERHRYCLRRRFIGHALVWHPEAPITHSADEAARKAMRNTKGEVGRSGAQGAIATNQFATQRHLLETLEREKC